MTWHAGKTETTSTTTTWTHKAFTNYHQIHTIDNTMELSESTPLTDGLVDKEIDDEGGRIGEEGQIYKVGRATRLSRSPSVDLAKINKIKCESDHCLSKNM